ncbi:MAG: hypothetical protein ABI461_04630 [Polyangiaceae bacterium]
MKENAKETTSYSPTSAPTSFAAPVGAAANPRGMKLVYTIVERKDGKSFWTRIGAAFTNRDGSLTLKLDAIPIGGTMQVRDWEPRDGEKEARSPASSPTPFGAGPSLAQAQF